MLYYHGVQCCITMGYSVVLPWGTVLYYHGVQCCITMGYSVVLPWGTVLYYHGVQCCITMGYSVVSHYKLSTSAAYSYLVLVINSY